VGCFERRTRTATGAIHVGSATRNGHFRTLTTGDIEEWAHLSTASGDAEPESVDVTDAKAPRRGGDT
jgi:hypothetical protein